MTDLKHLEEKLDLLIQRCQLLQQENDALSQERQQWKSDKTRLIEKNELARKRVEAMIDRLKELEAGAN